MRVCLFLREAVLYKHIYEACSFATHDNFRRVAEKSRLCAILTFGYQKLWISVSLTVPLDFEFIATNRKVTEMKAISPVRSVRSCYEAVCCISEQSVAISRSRSPSDEPVVALSDMNDCYSKLKELVPSIPQNKSVSQVEILQHVIDYIFDLQIALENETDSRSPSDVLLALKSSEITHNFSKEDGTLCH